MKQPPTTSIILKVGMILMLGLIWSCAANKPWRYDTTESAPAGCEKCGELIVERTEGVNDYDLAFIEFTDRGNLFSRKNVKRVYELLDRRLHDERTCPSGVSAIAYVHGWKHNARDSDGDIDQFKRRLQEFHDKGRSDRCLIGVYIGWRGRSISFPIVREFTYWDRKAAAHQLGKGGLTEVLLVMERMVRNRSIQRLLEGKEPTRKRGQDQFLTVGHSFGATAVLAALNEIMLERVVKATLAPSSDHDGECVATEPFGHGTVLLNPAVEANEILQLKEAFQMPKGGFCYKQPSLMHVISSRRDWVAHRIFPIGQFLGTNLRWRQTELQRNHGPSNTNITLSEKKLDTTTVGNYPPFFTGYMFKAGEHWQYQPMTNTYEPVLPARGASAESAAAVDAKPIKPYLYSRRYEPVKFIYTDRNFISNHNSVFNEKVVSYITAIAQETTARAYGRPGDVPFECLKPDSEYFDFSRCFNHFLTIFDVYKPDGVVRRTLSPDA